MAIEPSSAYFDESRLDSNSNFPVVAGFWNPIDVWMICEGALKDALRDRPNGLEAKKYVRQNSLRFAKILAAFTLHPIYATVERRVYGALWDAKGMEPLFANAYTTCCFGCCEMLDNYGLEHRWHGPVKVVFDDGAEGKDLWERGYRKYYAGQAEGRSKGRTLLSATPLFQKDHEALPLLGADLYAWLLSRKFNAGIDGEEAEALRLLETERALRLVLTDKQIGGRLTDDDANAQGKAAQ